MCQNSHTIHFWWVTLPTACPNGTYRSQSDPAGSCLQCPTNTDTSSEAAEICPCNAGFFRTEQEDQSANCTRKSDVIYVAQLYRLLSNQKGYMLNIIMQSTYDIKTEGTVSNHVI